MASRWERGKEAFVGVKLTRREADHSPPLTAEVKNEWRYTSSPTRLYGVHAEGFTFIYDQKPGHNSSYKSSPFYHQRNTEFPHRLRKITKKEQKTILKLFEFQVSVLIIYLPVIFS
jgi:hypothetical protein